MTNTEKPLHPTQRKLLAFANQFMFACGRPPSLVECTEHLGIDISNVYRACERLRARGLLIPRPRPREHAAIIPTAAGRDRGANLVQCPGCGRKFQFLGTIGAQQETL